MQYEHNQSRKIVSLTRVLCRDDFNEAATQLPLWRAMCCSKFGYRQYILRTQAAAFSIAASQRGWIRKLPGYWGVDNRKASQNGRVMAAPAWDRACKLSRMSATAFTLPTHKKTRRCPRELESINLLRLDTKIPCMSGGR
jgi:hypothetical protein